ncbi:MAG TPA: membrane protein insertase YidC [Candidatus Azoamicus sp.]
MKKKVIEKMKLNDLSNKESHLLVSSSEGINFNNEINNKEVIINTKLLYARINLSGGDVTYLILKKYLNDLNSENGIVLFDKSESKYFFAQSGFFEQAFSVKSNSSYNFSSNMTNYEILDGESDLYLNLKYQSSNVKLNKVYIFRNYSYEISVDFYLQNLSENILSGKILWFYKE